MATATKRAVAAGRAHGIIRGRGVRIVRMPSGPGILATTRGSAITITFVGDGIELHFRSDGLGGRVRITVDGRSRTFDLYASQATDRLFGWAALGSGTHTVRITALGTHRTGSRGTRVLLAALRVLAT